MLPSKGLVKLQLEGDHGSEQETMRTRLSGGAPELQGALCLLAQNSVFPQDTFSSFSRGRATAVCWQGGAIHGVVGVWLIEALRVTFCRACSAVVARLSHVSVSKNYSRGKAEIRLELSGLMSAWFLGKLLVAAT